MRNAFLLTLIFFWLLTREEVWLEVAKDFKDEWNFPHWPGVWAIG
jgi:hypothetical protein